MLKIYLINLIHCHIIQMCIDDGMSEMIAREMANAMANAQGLITIGVDDDGRYQ